MKVAELIEKLNEHNQEAEVTVIVHNKKEDFSLVWGGGYEGETKKDAPSVC